VESSEIEICLMEHSEIHEAAVIAMEDQRGESRLVAYCVPKVNPPPRTDTLRMFLSEKLPNYMIPSRFVMLDKMPLTHNGKFNRRILGN